LVDQTDIFNTNSPAPVDNPDDLLASIKNEQGEPKYKSVQEAIKALANSQAFIPQLLGEKKTLEDEIIKLREKASKLDNLDEVIAKLSAKDTEHNRQETPATESLSEEAVVNLVKNVLAQSQTENTAKTNLTLVHNSLASKFGEKTKEIVAKKAQELGTTPEKIGELSATDPSLVLALFQASPIKTVTPITSSVHLPNETEKFKAVAPTKSLLLGATSKEQAALMADIKREVYEKYGVTQ
jgi:hypothetical protein